MTTSSGGVRLGGTAEVAEELGVTRQQVADLRQQPGFPAPVATLPVGDVWDLDVVARWNNGGRKAHRKRSKKRARDAGRAPRSIRELEMMCQLRT